MKGRPTMNGVVHTSMRVRKNWVPCSGRSSPPTMLAVVIEILGIACMFTAGQLAMPFSQGVDTVTVMCTGACAVFQITRVVPCMRQELVHPPATCCIINCSCNKSWYLCAQAWKACNPAVQAVAVCARSLATKARCLLGGQILLLLEGIRVGVDSFG